MAWWVMPQLTMSLIGEYTHKEHVALQHYCSPLFLKSILQFPEQTLQWKNNLSSFSRTTRSLHMFHFLISDGAASVSIHCVDCNVWEKKKCKKLTKISLSSGMFWILGTCLLTSRDFASSSLSVTGKTVWNATHTEHFWSTVEQWGVGGNKAKEVEKNSFTSW